MKAVIPIFEKDPTFENLNLICLILDSKGMIVYANPFFFKSFGWKEEEIIGQDFFDTLVPAEERAKRREAFSFALQNGGVFDTKARTMLRRSGEMRWIQLNSTVYGRGEEKAQHLTVIGEDVTEQEQVTKALAESSAMLQDIIDNTSELILLVDLNGRFLFVNRAWQELLGYQEEEVAQLRLTDVIHPDFIDETIHQFDQIRQGQAIPDFETVFRKKNGRRVYLAGSVNCRFVGDQPVAFRCLFHNATNKVRAERVQNLYANIAKSAIFSDNLDTFYRSIHQELSKIIDVKNFFIAQYDADSGYLFFPYYQDEYFDKGVHFTRRKLGNGLTEFAIAANRPLILTDDQINDLAQKKLIYLYGVVPKVMVCVPLRVEDRVTGVIGLKSYERQNKFDNRDLDLLEFISGQIAVAIERKQTEERLNKQNARLDAIFQSSSHLMWSVNRRLLLTSFNGNYQELIQRRLDALPQLNWSTEKLGFRMITATNRRILEEKYRQAFQGKAQHFEMELDGAAGHGKVWLEIFLNPILLAESVIEEVSGIARDITEKKISEMALAESELKFRDIFESFQDIYTRTDLRGRIVMVSPSVLQRSGFRQEEVIGRKMSEFFVKGANSDLDIMRLLRKNDIVYYEAGIKTKWGETRDYTLNIRLIRDENNRPIAVEGVARDITDMRQSARELLKAKEEAERSLKVKERFLANMSHEIRTPMNGVIGMIDLLSDTPLQVEQRDYVETIKRSSQTLLNILNDILDLSKIEAGKMELHEAPLVFKELFDKLLALFSQTAQNKHNRLVLDFPADELPQYVIADETRLLQILSNLTSNAIKFTENGQITLVIRSIEQNGKFRKLKIEVRDTGIGIAAENLKILFGAFNQVDNSSTKTFGGTGLGLAISKELCRMMKGEIGVESVYGQGSTFWFTAWLKETSISPVISHKSEDEFRLLNFFQNQTPYLLLVDDNTVNRKVASEILLKAGCRVETADSGKKAIAMVEQTMFSGEMYQLILMDIQMPEMDGIETTQHLRQLSGMSLPPVIAMTAYSMKEDRDRFLSAGMDDYVPKPIRAEILVKKVKEWVDKKPSSQVVAARNRQHIEPVESYDSLISQPKIEVVKEPMSPIFGYQNEPFLNAEVVAQLKEMAGPEMVVSVFEDFVREAEEQIALSEAAYHRNDGKAIQAELHTLKGNAGTLGAMQLYEVVKFIETKAKQADFVHFEEEMAILKQLFQNFKEQYISHL
jgi:PAS domain S-box-containing protein